MGDIAGLELRERYQGYILFSKVRLDKSYFEDLRKEEDISPKQPQIFIYLLPMPLSLLDLSFPARD